MMEPMCTTTTFVEMLSACAYAGSDSACRHLSKHDDWGFERHAFCTAITSLHIQGKLHSALLATDNCTNSLQIQLAIQVCPWGWIKL